MGTTAIVITGSGKFSVYLCSAFSCASCLLSLWASSLRCLLPLLVVAAMRLCVCFFVLVVANLQLYSDALGTIYGAYAFSEHFLGVDSWWYWTDFVPAFVPSVSIPTSLSIQVLKVLQLSAMSLYM